jgi:hypothetical protein
MIKGFQVIVGIKGGESDHFAATAGHAIHPFNGGSINAPQGLVQNDTSKNFNPRYGLHDQSRAVGILVIWFLSTNPRMPRLRADLATLISVRLRPKTSGAECTWKSMAPAMGFWVGGGGGKREHGDPGGNRKKIRWNGFCYSSFPAG